MRNAQRIIVLLSFLLVGVVPLFSQTEPMPLGGLYGGDTLTAADRKIVSGGLKLGANMASMVLKGQPDISLRPAFGVAGGGFVTFQIIRHFTIQAELMFQNKRMRIYDGKDKLGRHNYWGVYLPVYLMAEWRFRVSDRLYIGAGPYADFGFSSVLKMTSGILNLYDEAMLSDTEIGVGLLFGYEFPFGMQLNFSCLYAFINMVDANSALYKVYPMSANVTVGYRFGRK